MEHTEMHSMTPSRATPLHSASFRSGLLVVVLLAAAVAFPSLAQANEAPSAPSWCTVETVGDDIVVAWSDVPEATSTVIRRTVDGGPLYWRGATDGTQFVDSNRNGAIVYSVFSKADNEFSEARLCTAGGGGLSAVGSCGVSVVGGDVVVTWGAAFGATAYVVGRSVDGGTNHWRGVTGGTEFVDSNRAGALVYTVTSKQGESRFAAPTTCTAGGGGLSAVGSCGVSVVGGDVVVTWGAASGATAYVVGRSVDGGTNYWRGVTEGTEFVDSNRAGALVYSVTSKQGESRFAAPTTCTAGGGGGGALGAPSNCTAVDDGDTVTVTWTRGEGAIDHVIRRSLDGSDDSWRGVSAGSSFVDTSREGSLVYRVEARRGDDERSNRVTCTNRSGVVPFTADAIVVGDMSTCDRDDAVDVSLLLDDIAGPIFGAGDYAHPGGTAAAYADCFDPDYGRHVDRISPVAGNHEYGTPNAAPYFDYFGAAAGDPNEGWFVQTHGDWQVLFLNSNCGEIGGCSSSSDQYEWVEDQLAAAPAGACRAVVWHHPRWSSSGPQGANNNLDDLVRLLHDNGLDLLLTGHSHFYERLARLNADGVADPANGFRQITVGTGGVAPLRADPAFRLPTSERLIIGEFGVLTLDLRDGSYEWAFVEKNGEVLDSGSDACIR